MLKEKAWEISIRLIVDAVWSGRIIPRYFMKYVTKVIESMRLSGDRGNDFVNHIFTLMNMKRPSLEQDTRIVKIESVKNSNGEIAFGMLAMLLKDKDNQSLANCLNHIQGFLSESLDISPTEAKEFVSDLSKIVIANKTEEMKTLNEYVIRGNQGLSHGANAA